MFERAECGHVRSAKWSVQETVGKLEPRILSLPLILAALSLRINRSAECLYRFYRIALSTEFFQICTHTHICLLKSHIKLNVCRHIIDRVKNTKKLKYTLQYIVPLCCTQLYTTIRRLSSTNNQIG